MNCRELVELLIDFVADELPPEHRERVEAHLRRCSPCLHYLETYRQTIQITRHLPCGPLPPELAVRLRAALEEIKKGEPPGNQCCT